MCAQKGALPPPPPLVRELLSCGVVARKYNAPLSRRLGRHGLDDGLVEGLDGKLDDELDEDVLDFRIPYADFLFRVRLVVQEEDVAGATRLWGLSSSFVFRGKIDSTTPPLHGRSFAGASNSRRSCC